MKELTISYFSIEYVLKELKKYPYVDLLFKKELSKKVSVFKSFLFFFSKPQDIDNFISDENEEQLAIDFCTHYNFPYEIKKEIIIHKYNNTTEQTLVQTIVFTVKANQYKLIEQTVLSDYQKKTEEIVSVGKTNASRMLSQNTVIDTATCLFTKITMDTVVAGRKAKKADIVISDLKIDVIEKDSIVTNNIINLRKYKARPLLTYEQKVSFLTAVLIKIKESYRDMIQGSIFLEKLDSDQKTFRILIVTNEISY